VHRRWVTLALALLASPHMLRAQEPRPRLQVIAYDAPRGCPGAQHFARRVAERLAADGVRGRGQADTAARVRVKLSAAAGVVRGRVTIEERASRALEGSSCREVVDGLALITALALTQEPSAPSRSPASAAEGKAPQLDGEATATDRNRTTSGTARASGREGAATRAAALGGDERGGPTRADGAVGREESAARAAADGGDVRRGAPGRGGEMDRAATSGEGAGERRAGGQGDARGAAEPRGADEQRGGAVARGSVGTSSAGERAQASSAEGRGGRRATPDADGPARADGGAARTGEGAVATRAGEGGGAPRAGEGVGGARTGEGGDAARAGEGDGAAPAGEGARLRIGAGFLLFQGLAPHLQPGLQLTAAVVWRTGPLELSAELRGRLALAQTLRADAGVAHFSFLGGAAALCAAAALGGTGLAARGCAVAEPGVLSWSATQTEQSRAYKRGWLALGPAAGLHWRSAWLGVGAGAELLWPVRRDRAVLAGDTLHQVPAPCLRLQTVLELTFDGP